MTPDERSLLTALLDDLAQAKGVNKDREAADLIDRAIRSNPDAVYLLVQHAILSNQAIANAKSRIADLESRLGLDTQSSFLGGGSPLSRGASGPWGNVGGSRAGYQPQPSGYPQGMQPQSGGAGSFLRNAAATAAGVAGGALLFEGLSGLLGGGHANAAGAPWDNGSFLGSPEFSQDPFANQTDDFQSDQTAGGDAFSDSGSDFGGGDGGGDGS